MEIELSDPIEKIVQDLILYAQTNRASDIHIQMIYENAKVYFRIDGIMKFLFEFEGEIAQRIFGRIKFLSKLKTYQESLPQDGRIDKEKVATKNDIRVSTYPTITGEKLVLRLFHEEKERNLCELGLLEGVIKELKDFLHTTSGLMLLTGPSGSGKTTTIYSCLRYLHTLGGKHIITVEDPVEQIIPDIMQTQINIDIGLTFYTAAKHLLRQDPQVLVIGEIRDKETVDIAVQSAFTGHITISTLHGGSCVSVLERFLSMSSDTYAALSCLKIIINQRLMRKTCKKCQGQSCETCLGLGYYGRIPIAEWLKFDTSLKKHIKEHNVADLVPAFSLEQSAKELISQKITDTKEYKRIFGYEI